MIKGDQKARPYRGINYLHLLCLQRVWETGKAQWLRGFQADSFQSNSKNSGTEQNPPTAGQGRMLVPTYLQEAFKNLTIKKPQNILNHKSPNVPDAVSL